MSKFADIIDMRAEYWLVEWEMFCKYSIIHLGKRFCV